MPQCKHIREAWQVPWAMPTPQMRHISLPVCVQSMHALQTGNCDTSKKYDK